MNNKTQIPRSATESGRFPKPDLTQFNPQEPPEPREKPEPKDPASATGVMRIITEGEDSAKQKDDSASGRKR